SEFVMKTRKLIHSALVLVCTTLSRESLAASPTPGEVSSWGSRLLPNLASRTKLTSIAGGGTHNLALKEDGSVIAWGESCYGQSTVPADLSNVVSVAAGY